MHQDLPFVSCNNSDDKDEVMNIRREETKQAIVKVLLVTGQGLPKDDDAIEKEKDRWGRESYEQEALWIKK